MREKTAAAGAVSRPCDLPATKCLVTHWLLVICASFLAASGYPLLAAEKSLAKTYITVELAFRLEPDRKNTAVVVGTWELVRDWLALMDQELRHHKSRLEVSALAGRLPDQLLKGVATLCPYPPTVACPGWRRLTRLDVPGSALRAYSIVFYGQPTGWERYWIYFISGLALIFVQTLFIIGLLLRRAREQKSGLHLQESEKRFRLIADTTPALVWMCDKDGNITYLNNRRIDFTGPQPAAGLGDVWSAFTHPDDLQSVLKANAAALKEQKGFSKEYRLLRRDDVYRWMLDIAAPRLHSDGSFQGFVGSAIDITEHKLAQEALAKIGGRLIAAQEKERGRIARELHDDICQRLALLSLELEQVNRESNGSIGPGDGKLDEIRRHCGEIAGDVQALSHELHSSKLDYLGITAAIRSLSYEFSQQHTVNIEFTNENVSGSLPRDVSLSLFRVTQEALHNALRHSGVRQFFVSLRGTPDEIQLEIRDRGVGFDVEGANQDRGLGLVSMQERVHLVDGIFLIESKVGSGTRILARVPWVVKTAGMQQTEP
jgi:PAS domain S-box-containing protein